MVQNRTGMPSQLVTCPETAHLEMIEYEESPVGMLLTSCSRFRPACAVTCPRTCSSRFDRRGLSAVDPTVVNGAAHDDDTAEVELVGMRPFVIEVTSLLRARARR